MGLKNGLAGILFLLAMLAAAVAPARGENPGTPAADAALNFDPFQPNATPAASTSATAGSIKAGAVSTPTSNAIPRTVICPTIIYVSANDAPTVVQSSTTTKTATFTVSLSDKSTTPVTVHYATSNGTATAGVDYTTKTGTLTFPPNTTSLPVTVTILKQSTESTLEKFYLNLTSPTGATISRAQGVATIQPPVIKIETSDPAAVDQSTTAYTRATIYVTLSAPATTAVTVKYATSDGTAKQNIDYQPVSDTLTFPPGVTSEPVKVWILPGSAAANRNFFLNLSSPAGAPGVTIADPKATITIVGQNAQNKAGLRVNDPYVMQSKTSNTTGQFIITLSTGSSTPVTVHFATADIPGQAVAGVDYLPTSGTVTFPPGQTSEVVPFTVLAGNLTTDKTFHLILSNAVGAPIIDGTGTATITPPTLTVAVGDAPPVKQSGLNSTTATFTVTLSGFNNKTVSVEYATADGSATHGTDYVATSGILTFPPYSISKAVHVTILPGSSTANRNFFLNLNTPSTGLTITRPQGLGTILGHQCGCVTLSVNDITVNQSKTANTTATFTVTLTNPASGPVTVHYATANAPNSGAGGGAEAGEDYTAKSGTLTFPVGTTSLPVTITILKETESFAEHFFLNLTNPTGAVISRAQGTCTIIPTNINIAVANSPPVHRSTSSSTFATFSVTLSSITEVPITVQYATADGTAVHGIDYMTTTGTLTFAPLTTTHTVQVMVLPGTQASNKTFYLKLSSPTGAGAVITTAQGSAVIDAPTAVPPPVLSINDISVIQSKTLKVMAMFTVTLSAAHSTPVTVHYATADGAHPGMGGGATAGSDYTAASGTLTIPANTTTATITVTIQPEAQTYEEAFQLNLSSPVGATIGDSQGTCTIIPSTINVTVNSPPLVQRKPGSNTSVVFTVTLSAATNTATAVEYATSDGSAVHSIDYVSKSGTLTFGPGQTTMTVTVTALPGSGSSTKTFYLNLIDAVGPGAVIATPKGTAQIKG